MRKEKKSLHSCNCEVSEIPLNRETKKYFRIQKPKQYYGGTTW